MSADIISLAAYRPREPRAQQPAAPQVARLPLVIQAHQGAVCLELPDTEFWLSPAQALEIAADLIQAAADAEGATR